KVLIERWQQFYNEKRPHSAHGYEPPATVRRNWSEPDNIHPGLTALLATSSILRSGMLASLGQPPGDVASRGVCPGKSGCFAVPDEVMYWLYLATLVFLLIASYALHRTSADAGMQPVPGTAESTAYRWFGGGLATLGILALLG